MTPETMIQICLGLPLVALLLVVVTGKIPNLREACTITTSSVLFCDVSAGEPCVCWRPSRVELGRGDDARFCDRI